MQHLGFRRGITHGPIAWVLLPLLLAGAAVVVRPLAGAARARGPRGAAGATSAGFSRCRFIACLTHPALDWLNVYGVRLLEPFSSRWFYGDTLFIIDVWLWALMGFATWFSLRREKRGGEWRRPARIAIAAALAYIGVNAAHQRALAKEAPMHGRSDARPTRSSPAPAAGRLLAARADLATTRRSAGSATTIRSAAERQSPLGPRIADVLADPLAAATLATPTLDAFLLLVARCRSRERARRRLGARSGDARFDDPRAARPVHRGAAGRSLCSRV